MTTAQPATPITSFGEVRQQWEELLSRSVVNNLYITPAWQELWWSAFQNGRSLAGFYLTDASGQLTALASLSRCGDNFSFVGNSDTFDYNDFVIARGAERAFFPALLDTIDSGGGQQLDLYSVGQDSPTLTMLPELARERGYSVDIAEEDVAPRIDLPPSWDDYLAGLSKKDRHELRRKLRRLEGYENWRWFCVSDPGEASDRADTFLALMRNSDPAKAEFLTKDREDFFRKLIATTAAEGVLRLFFMEMDDKPVAASLCLDYDGVRMLYNSGHDTEYRYYSVGLLLHALSLRDALERGYRYFDFLRGNESYKYRLGGRDHHLYRITLQRSDSRETSGG